MRKMKKSLYERFIEKIGPVNENGCRLWLGATARNGYGNFGIAGGKTINVHRLAYMIFIGAIPDGMDVCHTCDVRRCVNQDHLFLGTRLENIQDMVKKGRGCRGEKQGASKLTESQVREIMASKETGISLAKKYGVGPQQISRIKNGLRWKHVHQQSADKEALAHRYRRLALKEAREQIKAEAERYA